MAVDMFLKFEGKEIKGESIDFDHAEEIDVLAWSWGLSQSGTMHLATGGGSGKVAIQDISLTKYLDSASPNLALFCCNGDHIPTAILTVRKAGGTPVEYLIITMENVLISSVGTGGSGGEDRLTENVTLNFAKVTWKYTPQDSAGAALTEIEHGWDIPANEQTA